MKASYGDHQSKGSNYYIWQGLNRPLLSSGPGAATRGKQRTLRDIASCYRLSRMRPITVWVSTDIVLYVYTRFRSHLLVFLAGVDFTWKDTRDTIPHNIARSVTVPNMPCLIIGSLSNTEAKSAPYQVHHRRLATLLSQCGPRRLSFIQRCQFGLDSFGEIDNLPSAATASYNQITMLTRT